MRLGLSQAVNVRRPLIGGGGGGGGTTWDPAAIGTGVTLSDGNLTAENGLSEYNSARSTTSKATGKKYFECTADVFTIVGSYAAAATAIAASDLNGYLGFLSDESAYYADGSVYVGNAIASALAAYTTGDVIGCAIDVDAGKGWYSKNGVFASGDPAAGTGEHFTFTPAATIFAGFTLGVQLDKTTANFGATAFNAAPPTGFSAWG